MDEIFLTPMNIPFFKQLACAAGYSLLLVLFRSIRSSEEETGPSPFVVIEVVGDLEEFKKEYSTLQPRTLDEMENKYKHLTRERNTDELYTRTFRKYRSPCGEIIGFEIETMRFYGDPTLNTEYLSNPTRENEIQNKEGVFYICLDNMSVLGTTIIFPDEIDPETESQVRKLTGIEIPFEDTEEKEPGSLTRHFTIKSLINYSYLIFDEVECRSQEQKYLRRLSLPSSFAEYPSTDINNNEISSAVDDA